MAIHLSAGETPSLLVSATFFQNAMQTEESDTAGKGVPRCSASKLYHSECCSATFSSPSMMHQSKSHLEQTAADDSKRIRVQ
jgi:hypothetical protein